MQPPVPSLQPVHHHRPRDKLVRAAPVRPQVIVHRRRLLRHPVLRLVPPPQPPPHQLILRSHRVARRDLRRDGRTVPEVAAVQRPQRRRDRCQPYERVVIGLHHVVAPMREDGCQRGEVGVRLAGVHVLGALEDDDVLEAEDLQCDQHPLLGLGEPT
ncbi:hypothetical protein GW17_00021639 [Ensete ventricosum]|nr:hypothetical protein GW17_00021639 [Ensete ventricosum]